MSNLLSSYMTTQKPEAAQAVTVTPVNELKDVLECMTALSAAKDVDSVKAVLDANIGLGMSVTDIDELGMEGVKDILDGLTGKVKSLYASIGKKLKALSGKALFDAKDLLKRIEILEGLLADEENVRTGGDITLIGDKGTSLLIDGKPAHLVKELAVLNAQLKSNLDGDLYKAIAYSFGKIPMKNDDSIAVMSKAIVKSLISAMGAKPNQNKEYKDSHYTQDVNMFATKPGLGDWAAVVYVDSSDGQLSGFDTFPEDTKGRAEKITLPAIERTELVKILAAVKDNVALVHAKAETYATLDKYVEDQLAVLESNYDKNWTDEDGDGISFDGLLRDQEFDMWFAMEIAQKYSTALNEHSTKVSNGIIAFIRAHV